VEINGRGQSSCSSQSSEFGGDLPVNEVTWPEIAHQYLVTLIEVFKSGDPGGWRPKECKRLVRCLQGDGGVLLGAAAIVVALESDAQISWSFPRSNWVCLFFLGRQKYSLLPHTFVSHVDFFFLVGFCGPCIVLFPMPLFEYMWCPLDVISPNHLMLSTLKYCNFSAPFHKTLALDCQTFSRYCCAPDAFLFW